MEQKTWVSDSKVVQCAIICASPSAQSAITHRQVIWTPKQMATGKLPRQLVQIGVSRLIYCLSGLNLGQGITESHRKQEGEEKLGRGLVMWRPRM
jgi:hypothetical protein